MKYLIYLSLVTLLIATSFAFEAGETCYLKQQKQNLRLTPDRDGEVSGTVSWGAALKVVEVQDKWVKISDGKNSGWVFGGNLSKEKPPAENHNNFLPTSSDTSAAIAARPLAGVSKEYASRHNCSDAVGDVEWLESNADSVTSAMVREFEKANNLGEFSK